MIPINIKDNKPYKKEQVFNVREAKIADEMYEKGFVVLKRGWPDLFCYNPETQETVLIEVKSLRKPVFIKGINEFYVKKRGLSRDQMRMHQYLKKIGFEVKIVWVE